MTERAFLLKFHFGHRRGCARAFTHRKCPERDQLCEKGGIKEVICEGRDEDSLSPTMALSPSGAMRRPFLRVHGSRNLRMPPRIEETQDKITSGQIYYKIKALLRRGLSRITLSLVCVNIYILLCGSYSLIPRSAGDKYWIGFVDVV